MMDTKKMVYPGDLLGTSEEFGPGPGTYEDDGKVFSAMTGIFDIDSREMCAVVVPKTPPLARVRQGDVILGSVTDLRPQMAIVDVFAIEGIERSAITGNRDGTLHVSRISRAYIERIEGELMYRDIIRAEVVQDSPSIQLSIEAPEFGVVHTVCKACRRPMTLKDNKVYCAECDTTDHRKLSDKYGAGST